MCLTKLQPTLAVFLAVVLLALGPAVVLTPAAGKTAALAGGDQKQEVKVQWQYKVITRPELEKLAPRGSKDRFTAGLNALGEQGWELVAVEPGQPELGGMMGLGPPRGPGPRGLQPPKMKPSTYLFKRPR
jgi:hypothetical protein